MFAKDIALDSDDVIIAVPIDRVTLSVLAPFGGGQNRQRSQQLLE